MKLLNAFSVSMLDPTYGAEIRFTPVSLERARELSREAWSVPDGPEQVIQTPFGPQRVRAGVRIIADSAVGHADTAALFGKLLSAEVAVNRETVRGFRGDALVGQYQGPRLPEGTTVLPEGASIQWWYIHWMGNAISRPLDGPWADGDDR